MAFPSEIVTLPGSGLVFHNEYGAAVPAAYRTAVIAAENYFQARFVDAVTLDLSFDLTVLPPAFSAQNLYDPVSHVDYPTLRAALDAHASTPDDKAAVAALPATDPSNGDGFAVPVGMARILGLAGPAIGVDDRIFLNSRYNWTYGTDAIGALEHEISEGAMGRVGGLGVQGGFWGPMDLFRYSAPGQHDYSANGSAAAFSVDGALLLTPFNDAASGGDLADWADTSGDAFGPTGVSDPGTVTDTDLRVLDILGWTPVGQTAPDHDFAQNPTAPAPPVYAMEALDPITVDIARTTAHTFTVTRTGDAAQPASLGYAITGSGANPAPASLFVNPMGVVAFAPGATSATIIVNVNGASIPATETFTVTLSGATGATITTPIATGTIEANVTVLGYAIAATDAAKVDQLTGTTPYLFTVTRNGDTSGAEILNYSVSGTGANPAPASLFTNPSGTVSFAAGASGAVLTVDVKGASITNAETFAVTLSNAPSGSTLCTPTATGTIQANAASYAITAQDASKPDALTGTTPYTFLVTRSGDVSQAATLHYAVAGVGANPAPASLFVNPTGGVSFDAGASSAVLSMNVNGASIPAAESFAVTLSNAPTGSTITTPVATGTIDGNNFLVEHTQTGVQELAEGEAYPATGPVEGVEYQYINITSDNLNITANRPNTFIHTGSGFDAIDVSHVGGRNVLDGYTNSNFLVGGTGAGSQDSFFVDDRSAPSDIWSTVVNFHAGDDATVWGVTPGDFQLDWFDDQGAVGYQGLTLHATAAGRATASLTLVGYTQADLTNGRLSTSFGSVDGNTYMYVHGDR